jgi:hypothetical protein
VVDWEVVDCKAWDEAIEAMIGCIVDFQCIFCEVENASASSAG